MRPSVPATLEPGSERGLPWGRDLYTFVTSAAGHMMRTLQKPRKNRPSKRQVNHRRFLHNMIQRKFADIEAANHRLASAIYFKEEDRNAPSAASEKPESDDASETNPPAEPQKRSLHRDADGHSRPASDVSVGSRQTEDGEKKQLSPAHLWKRQPKSQSTTGAARRNSLSTGRQKRARGGPTAVGFALTDSPKGTDYHSGAAAFQPEPCEDSSHVKAAGSLPQAHTLLQDAGFTPDKDASPSFSPPLSPLSIDSCDFSIQMLTDVCAHPQRSIADMEESQWADIMDLFGGDAEACVESVGAEQLPFPGPSHSLCSTRCESEDPCGDGGEYGAYGRQRGPGTNPAGSAQFNSFAPARGPDAPISYHYAASAPHTYQSPQEDGRVLGGCENHLHFTPFEGVAQSFCAPLHPPEHRSIPTPPRDDDWLFTDILKDTGEPPGC
ncbi:uncharacterized protein LOC129603152 [Betta splendens]|uniref:Uncharacterized protein LOC129603152 n=1 Tax=Betta splendens TaxID=158456 RepID=A0A9W2XB63_BETSP|nr:uncharacterized protein LOC129603152 [Betta splendens]